MTGARSFIVNTPREPESKQGPASWYTPGHSDGLGDRLLMFDNTTASSLELLRFKREFSDSAAFEAALRRRIDELDGFSHPAVAKVRAVDRLGPGEGLALISNYTPGRRLSEIVHEARGPTFALELIRQLTPVLATLQRQGDGIAHGALTAQRIVVTPEGQLVIVEHVLGAALESLGLPAERLRSELGIVVPPRGEQVALDRRADVIQLACVALSLLLGRRLDPADYPLKSADLLAEFALTDPRGAAAAPGLRLWLEQALQLTGPAFESAQDAHDALNELSEDGEPPPEPHRTLHAGHAPVEAAASAAIQPTPNVGEDDAEAPAQPVEVPVVAGSPRTTSDVGHPGSVTIVAGPSNSESVPGGRPNTFEFWQATRMTEATRHIEAPRTPLRPTAPEAATAIKWGQDSSPLSRTVRLRGLGDILLWVAAGLAAVAIGEAIVIGGLVRARRLAGLPAGPTAIMVESPQPGAEVMVDGRRAGLTPLKLNVGAETHSIRVLPPEEPVDAATRALPPTPAPLTRLEIASDPVGARVMLDGAPRGVTPLSTSVSPGPHTVVLSEGLTTVSRTITVAAGSTATVMATLTPAGAVAGWLAITVPLELQVLEGGNLIGSTSAAKLMLPAGHHDLELTNAAVGFRTTVPVDIQPGKTVTTTVTVPNGSVSINALPWANVWLDGRALGTTPIANLDVPLGTHEVIWRHPQFGERRQTVVVTAKSPVRLVMDLSK
jgi:hypothetical protein